MSEPVELATYSFEDYTQRRCLLSEVGKVKYDDGYARRLARQVAGKAMDALVEVVTQGDDLNAKVKAAQVILDRGFGRAEQTIKSDQTNAYQFPDPPWLSARRLAYQMASDVATDIESKGERSGPWEAHSEDKRAEVLKVLEANPSIWDAATAKTRSAGLQALPKATGRDPGEPIPE